MDNSFISLVIGVGIDALTFGLFVIATGFLVRKKLPDRLQPHCDLAVVALTVLSTTWLVVGPSFNMAYALNRPTALTEHEVSTINLDLENVQKMSTIKVEGEDRDFLIDKSGQTSEVKLIRSDYDAQVTYSHIFKTKGRYQESVYVLVIPEEEAKG